jgi:hypothetical protein
MSKGHSCYRPRRTGERKRKTVRGCIVDSDIRVLAVSIVKKGEKDIEGNPQKKKKKIILSKKLKHKIINQNRNRDRKGELNNIIIFFNSIL